MMSTGTFAGILIVGIILALIGALLITIVGLVFMPTLFFFFFFFSPLLIPR